MICRVAAKDVDSGRHGQEHTLPRPRSVQYLGDLKTLGIAPGAKSTSALYILCLILAAAYRRQLLLA